MMSGKCATLSYSSFLIHVKIIVSKNFKNTLFLLFVFSSHPQLFEERRYLDEHSAQVFAFATACGLCWREEGQCGCVCQVLIQLHQA